MLDLILQLGLTIIVAYLIGAIPTGYLIVKSKTGQDLRTIGSGSTTHIDNEGEETRVEMGDEMSAEQAMINKWKYVEKYLLSFCGDKVGRSLSDKEIYSIKGEFVLFIIRIICMMIFLNIIILYDFFVRL